MASSKDVQSKDMKKAASDVTDKDGNFKRGPSQFRNWVSTDPEAKFLAEKGRYVLYLNLGCPW